MVQGGEAGAREGREAQVHQASGCRGVSAREVLLPALYELTQDCFQRMRQGGWKVRGQRRGMF